ncbi:MAG: glycosyltransferase [Desulfamplus sp.]|nr:glycosyltransferase [Desulfamplus sp.]
MRFLFIDFTLPYLLKDASYPVGGWAVQLNAWIRGLTACGHQVGVLTWKGANDFIKKPLEFELIETYDPAKGIKILKYFYNYVPTLYKKSSEYQPDVIIQACAGLNTGIMAWISRRLKTPFVHRIANDVDVDQRYQKTLKKYEQKAYEYGLKKSNMVLCQNSYQYDSLHSKFPNKPLQIIVNPFFPPCQYKNDIPSYKERNYIAWIGVFKKQKNLTLLSVIAKQLPDIIFKIAGMRGKSLDKETTEALFNLDSLPNVEFLGYLSREQVIPFLANAKALLNTSYHEGFSNTFLEAFYSGTPVIAPVHADPGHIIQKNGLGVSVTKSEEFPVQIMQFYNDTILFEKTSLRCQDYVIKNHDPEIQAKKLVELVSNIK